MWPPPTPLAEPTRLGSIYGGLRLLVDEDIGRAEVDALRDYGNDVVWVREQMLGASDERVLFEARLQHRILVTYDGDFSDLLYVNGMSAPAGLIHLRKQIRHIAERVLVANTYCVLEKHLTVMRRERWSQTLLPQLPGVVARGKLSTRPTTRAIKVFEMAFPTHLRAA